MRRIVVSLLSLGVLVLNVVLIKLSYKAVNYLGLFVFLLMLEAVMGHRLAVRNRQIKSKKETIIGEALLFGAAVSFMAALAILVYVAVNRPE